MLTERQYNELLPYKKYWDQLKRDLEMHCNANFWKALCKVSDDNSIYWDGKILRPKESCGPCKAGGMRAVMEHFDEYEAKQARTKAEKIAAAEKPHVTDEFGHGDVGNPHDKNKTKK